MNGSFAAKAPWHLWLVGVLSLLWDGFGTFDFTATAARVEPYLAQFPPAMMDYIDTLPAWMWVVWFVGVFGGLVGAVLLLLRRKAAVWAFVLSFAGAAISRLTSIVDPPPPEAGDNPALAWIIIVLAIAQVAYAAWLGRRGVLR
jgi:hypothetical protein